MTDKYKIAIYGLVLGKVSATRLFPKRADEHTYFRHSGSGAQRDAQTHFKLLEF